MELENLKGFGLKYIQFLLSALQHSRTDCIDISSAEDYSAKIKLDPISYANLTRQIGCSSSTILRDSQRLEA